MRFLMNFLKGIFQSSIGKWILYALIGLVLFKVLTFVLGLFFPPAAFILNNLFWIAIVAIGIYFFVKFRSEKPEAETLVKKTDVKTKPKSFKRKVVKTVPVREKSIFEIIDEESN